MVGSHPTKKIMEKTMTENDLPVLIPPSKRSEDWDPSGPAPMEMEEENNERE